MTQRVFVTGMSAVTSCGMDLEANWTSVMTGHTGIAPITSWQLDDWEYCLGGELKDYQPRKMLPDKKLLKVISKQDVFGIHAACQAVEDSGLIDYRDSLKDCEDFNNRTGIYVGSPGNKYCQQYDFLPLLAKSQGDMQVFADTLFETVHPMWLLKILPNNVLAYTGITYGFKGPNHNVANHAVSSVQAIIEAYHAIKHGQIDRAVVVGYDIGLEPQAIINYSKLGLISQTDLKPFNRSHDGTILAEGAGALVLESEASVYEREGAKCAEMFAGFSLSEGLGIFSLEEEGQSLSNLIERTLAVNAFEPNEVGMITAHGNGNPKSDDSEAMAIERVFAHHMPAVTSFKWAMGHTLAASGIIDSVLMAQSLKQKTVPGIANFTTAAPSCQGLRLSADHQALQRPLGLLINRGFGGMDATLMLKACE